MSSSTVVAEHGAVPAVPTDSAILARRGTVAAIAGVGLVAAVGGGLLLATSDHLVHGTEYGIEVAVSVLGCLAASLYWIVRRPGNRLGMGLLALAVATAAVSLQGATNPALHTIGVWGSPSLFLLSYYVAFAFPQGRVVGWPERALLAAWVLYFLTATLPYLLFSPVVAGGAPLARCDTDCPGNALLIADRPELAAPFGGNMSYAVIALGSATLVCLVYRLATVTRPRRRALLPVYIPAVMLTAPVLVFHGVIRQLLDVSPTTISDVGWFVTVGRTALPFGFLLSIVLATFFAAAALKTIVGRLVCSPNASQLRRILADALDDPSLELAFPVDRAGRFVGSSGSPVSPTPAAGRVATPVARDGETVALIMHDEALETDPELVAASGQALLLTIENGRLLTEVESASAELRDSRARILAAGDAERRRIERDLHDGAQQHLVALRIKVGLAGELAEADPEAALRLADLGAELEEILQELRDLAQGLDPPVLRQFGLREALASVSRRTTPPVKLEAESLARYSDDIESAVYFCCLEALQNVGKHAGADAQAVIRLRKRGDQLTFEVCDDGIGYDVERIRSPGQGLGNMSDRIAALGGTFVIESAPGRGTSVRGSVRVPI